MKKNRAMRAASALLVAVLMTTCTISGTFAKYVTEASGTDTARVAKWGVTVTATGTTFAEKYADVAGDNGTKVVSSEKVVAPGTRGSLANVTISGTPEVATQVTYDAELTLTNWGGTADWDGDPSTANDDAVYCPLIFTVGTTDYSIWGTDIAGLEALVEEAIEDIKGNYAAGANLSDANDDLNVSWRWEFEPTLLPGYQTDAKDTALGNLATAPTVTLTVKTIITQVD